MKKVYRYKFFMIMIGERLENKLFAIILYIPVGHVKYEWLMPSAFCRLHICSNKRLLYIMLSSS